MPKPGGFVVPPFPFPFPLPDCGCGGWAYSDGLLYGFGLVGLVVVVEVPVFPVLPVLPVLPVFPVLPRPPVVAYLPKNAVPWNGSVGCGKSPQYPLLACYM